ncbi:hypothetical protein THAOC_16166 [Thalassiosira oceanica]|uniref:Uncharacterized protein n=1 Tax=Thalassiosira oceanica TaxID=159749 RepID=K0SCY9_THAOC|nr:hypothetical protein THAOC_16166 [Thalassiosira oceanica]|eukprot:EJK63195.1 hypothetical protein THAOC_16166 [Thalassiosira oceanica]
MTYTATGLASSLQCEWQYICRVVEGAEQRYLEPLEKTIREEFLPALLGVDKAEIGNDLHNLIAHSVKNGGLAIPNPVKTAAFGVRFRASVSEWASAAGSACAAGAEPGVYDPALDKGTVVVAFLSLDKSAPGYECDEGGSGPLLHVRTSWSFPHP